MLAYEIPQFIYGVVRLVDFFPQPAKRLLGPETEKMNQNVIFIFEIKVDGAICNSGFFGDL
jgi:hypothetical protein